MKKIILAVVLIAVVIIASRYITGNAATDGTAWVSKRRTAPTVTTPTPQAPTAPFYVSHTSVSSTDLSPKAITWRGAEAGIILKATDGIQVIDTSKGKSALNQNYAGSEGEIKIQIINPNKTAYKINITSVSKTGELSTTKTKELNFTQSAMGINKPQVTGVSPSPADIGAKLTVTGENFVMGPKNAVEIWSKQYDYTNSPFKVASLSGITSLDGKTLQFDMPRTVKAYTPVPGDAPSASGNVEPLVAGTYYLRVINSNGLSASGGAAPMFPIVIK